MGTIKLKRGNLINFENVTLQAGEPAFVMDTGKLYIGNGTDKILINPDNLNSETATKLANARLITVSGDGSGSTSFDGSANTTISLVLANTGVAAGTYTKVTVDAKGRITSATNMVANDVPNITLSKITDAGTVASKNVGTGSGNIPILDSNGKLDTSILPSITISDTFVINSQTNMLALTAEVGDIAIRTDLSKTFILKTAGASTLANWQELLTPTDSVTSVAGKTGSVTLNSGDVGLGNVTNESKATMFTSPSLTGTPTAPTAAVATNTTQVATTAFVKSQGYITSAGAPIQTVAGRTGTVVLTATDVGLANVTNESKATMFASPALTGVPTAPTAVATTNTTQVATTAFVKSQNYITSSGAPVQSVAGKTGSITLTSTDVGLGNVINESKSTMFTSSILTGDPTAPTQATSDNSTKLATTAFVKAQGYLNNVSDLDGGTF